MGADDPAPAPEPQPEAGDGSGSDDEVIVLGTAEERAATAAERAENADDGFFTPDMKPIEPTDEQCAWLMKRLGHDDMRQFTQERYFDWRNKPRRKKDPVTPEEAHTWCRMMIHNKPLKYLLTIDCAGGTIKGRDAKGTNYGLMAIVNALHEDALPMLMTLDLGDNMRARAFRTCCEIARRSSIPASNSTHVPSSAG